MAACYFKNINVLATFWEISGHSHPAPLQASGDAPVAEAASFNIFDPSAAGGLVN